MAHKYDVPDLKRDALNRIKELYTDDFYSFHDPRVVGADCRLSYRWQDAFQVVRLSHLTGDKSLLPVALYLCCASPPFFSTRGMIELAAGGQKQEQEQAEVSLSEEDVFRCVRARPFLVRAPIRVLASTFEGGLSVRCTEAQRCKSSYKRVLHTMLEIQSNTILWDASVDCLSIFASDLMVEFFSDSDFCNECEALFSRNNREARKLVWKELPHYLELQIEGWGRGLGAWRKLRKRDARY